MKTTFFIYDLKDNQNRPIVDTNLDNRSMDMLGSMDGWDSASEAQQVIEANGWQESCAVYEYDEPTFDDFK
jgi:hypothetical protein